MRIEYLINEIDDVEVIVDEIRQALDCAGICEKPRDFHETIDNALGSATSLVAELTRLKSLAKQSTAKPRRA